MNVEATYHRYLKLTGEAGAAASLVLAEAMAGQQPQPTVGVLTVAEAAAHSRLSERMIYKAVSSKKLKRSGAGRAIRIKLSDLEAYLSAESEGRAAESDWRLPSYNRR